MAATLIAMLALVAVVRAVFWRRPDPNQEFMLDLYSCMIGEDVEGHSNSEITDSQSGYGHLRRSA